MVRLAKAKQQTENSRHGLEGSFRDPAGFVYRDRGGRLLRQINRVGTDDYTAARDCGLYDKLTAQGLLVPHTELKGQGSSDKIVIEPLEISPITYPFEWSFSMLKDAAVATLRIQEAALEHGMSLKDASAYNIQFVAGKPQFIDTLSFEPYHEGRPWVAYGQFCRHFLAPLALMAYEDVRLSQLQRAYVDGIPLDLAVKLLPQRARYKPALFIHMVMHAKACDSKSRDHRQTKSALSKLQLLAILSSLERAVKALKSRGIRTEWMDYYDNTNYSDDAAKSKEKLIKKFTKDEKPGKVLDLGGNDGRYGRIFSSQGIDTVCADIDPNAVEINYLQTKRTQEKHMLPLLVDLTNPGGALGWANTERQPVNQRLQADLAMALALIHHLAISNNLPFGMIAEYFGGFAPLLIIEFVPKEDSQVQKLLATRRDIFDDYTQDQFEKQFGKIFKIERKEKIAGSKRTLYLLRRKRNG